MNNAISIDIEKLQLVNIDDEKVNLDKGKRRLLTFRRDVGCPVCFHRFFDFRDLALELNEKLAEIILFSPSTKDKLKLALKGWNVPFQIVSDPQNKWFDKFSVKKSLELAAEYRANPANKTAIMEGFSKFPNEHPVLELNDGTLPAELLFDQENKTYINHYYSDIDDKLDLSIIRKFLKLEI